MPEDNTLLSNPHIIAHKVQIRSGAHTTGYIVLLCSVYVINKNVGLVYEAGGMFIATKLNSKNAVKFRTDSFNFFSFLKEKVKESVFYSGLNCSLHS